MDDSLCSKSVLIWTLLITCSFYFHLVTRLVESYKFQHHNHAKKYDSIAFLAVGDWGRNGGFNQSLVAYQMGKIGEQLGIDFVVSTGDNFYDNGLEDEKDPLFKTSFVDVYTAKSLMKQWYIVLGNHDYLGNTRAQLSENLRKFDKRWHCERNFFLEVEGLVDIVFIDTTPFVNQYFENPKEQKFDWRDVMPRDKYLSAVKKNLDSLLKKSKAPWKIVVGHHAIRSIGHHGYTQEIVDQILPILEANKVDMHINGHDHCLEHLSNKAGKLHFLTSGGGSKAWKNDIHYSDNRNSTHFYYDGQGFLAVKLVKKLAQLAFYDVTGRILHQLEIKA